MMEHDTGERAATTDSSAEDTEISGETTRKRRKTIEDRLKNIVEPCLGLDIDRILTCKLRNGHSGPHIDPESKVRWEPEER